MTAAALVRFQLSTAGVAIQPGGSRLQIERTAAAGETFVIPFRFCSAVTGTPAQYEVEASPRIGTAGGSTFALGAYSVTARWSITGNYAP